MVNRRNLEMAFACFTFLAGMLLAFFRALFFADGFTALCPCSVQLYFMSNVLAELVRAADFNFLFPVLQDVGALVVRTTEAAGDGGFAAFLVSTFLCLSAGIGFLVLAGTRAARLRPHERGEQG